MKIAFTGTRGIPNRYGGFEEFAEQLSIRLAERGHDVLVYNPLSHPNKETIFNGVRIIWMPAPLHYWPHVSGLIYDYRCLKDALRQKADIILNCGYGSAIFYPFFGNQPGIAILTHMDGMEWQRGKWGCLARSYLKLAERMAVKRSDYMVTDHRKIQDYYITRFGKHPLYIPYGSKHTEVFKLARFRDVDLFKEIGIHENAYVLIISRLEPENNLDRILKGYLISGLKIPIVIVGHTQTKYSTYLSKKYASQENIKFIGPVYNEELLTLLRYHCLAYMHGHSVGGTNPSLLDAMRSGCLIISHDNDYNRDVLGDNGLYFRTCEDVGRALAHLNNYSAERKKFAEKNIEHINRFYNWQHITNQYIDLFKKITSAENPDPD